MVGGASRQLRAGARLLRVGGFAQLGLCALALIASLLTLLLANDPNQEPPTIALVFFVWFPVAAVFGSGGFLSFLGARVAHRGGALRSGLLGLVGGLVPTVAIINFAIQTDIPPLIVAAILLPPMVSLGGVAVSATSPERRTLPDAVGP